MLEIKCTKETKTSRITLFRHKHKHFNIKSDSKTSGITVFKESEEGGIGNEWATMRERQLASWAAEVGLEVGEDVGDEVGDAVDDHPPHQDDPVF